MKGRKRNGNEERGQQSLFSFFKKKKISEEKLEEEGWEGRRVEIYWPEEEKWKAAKIVKRNGEGKEVDVQYDEGKKEEQVDLNQETVRATMGRGA